MEKKTNMFNSVELGKVPPQNIKLEEAILGAVLIEKHAHEEVSLIIDRPEVFYIPKHQEIWKAILSLVSEGIKIDLLTVTQKLIQVGQLNEIGGAGALAELTSKVASTSHVRTHCLLVKDLSAARDFIFHSHDTLANLYNGTDPYAVYKALEDNLSNVFNYGDDGNLNFNETSTLFLNDIEGKMNSETPDRILTKSYFDKVFDFTPNELIWVGALPKASKTRTITKVMQLLLKNNSNVAIRWWSMEDTTNSIMSYFAAIESKLYVDHIISKENEDKLTQDEFENIKDIIEEYRKFDVDISYGGVNINKIYSEAKQFVRKRKNKLNIIIIDNFNILLGYEKGDTNAKEIYVADKIQKLKIDTNSDGYNTVVIVLDHLNKSASKEGIEVAYRPSADTLKGAGRKGEVLTQLVSINKPGEFKDLVAEEATKQDIVISGEKYTREFLMKHLIIYESLTSRASANKNPVRFLADLGNMQFTSYDEMRDKDGEFQKKIEQQEQDYKDNPREIESNIIIDPELLGDEMPF